MSSLEIFEQKSVNDKIDDFLFYFEEEYLALRTEDDTLATFSRKVRDTIFANAHIGVFKSVDWQAKYIAGHSRLSSCMYTHDNRYVYCCGEKLKDRKGNTIEGIVADKFHILSRHFMSDGENVYCEQKAKAKHDLTSTFALLNKVDIASFRTVGLYYGIDNNAIYYYTNKHVKSSSSQHLKPIMRLFLNYKKESFYEESKYAIDKESVFYKGKKISTFPEKFHQINASYYFSDEHQLYYRGKAIPEADLSSFQTDHPHIDSSDFGFDKNYEYFCGKPRKNTD